MNIEQARVRVVQRWSALHPRGEVLDSPLVEIFAGLLKDTSSELQERVAYQSKTIADLDLQIKTQAQKLTKAHEGNQKIAAAGQRVCLRLVNSIQRENELIDQIVDLHLAADALYMAGRWVLSKDAGDGWDQAKLWEDLRDALGYEPGHSFEARVNAIVKASDPDVTLEAGKTYTSNGDEIVEVVTPIVASDDGACVEDATEEEILNYHLEEIKWLLEDIAENTFDPTFKAQLKMLVENSAPL